MRIVERVQMMGPGLVFALGSIGARDLISNSVAGSLVGLGMVWGLVLAVGARYVLLDASAKLGLGLSREELTNTPPIRDWVWWKNKEAVFTIGDAKPRYQQDNQQPKRFLGLF
jgi:Mn2+/Fe2+ NRAMP family transporter